MLAFTFLTISPLGLILSKKLLGDYFSPPAIYHFFWCFALGSLALDWVAYHPVDTEAWTAIALGYLGFMGGGLSVLAYGLARPRVLHREPRLDYIGRRKMEVLLFLMFLLGIFGFLLQLYHLQSQIGLTTFLEAPGEARELHSNVKYLGFFNILNVANFVLSLMYLVLFKKPARWVILIMLWALATTFVTTDRTRFFYMVIWSFFIVAYLYRRVNLTPRVILAVLSTVSVLLLFFLLIAKLYKKQAFEDNMEYVRLSEEWAPLVDPYIYLTGGFPVLQAFIDDKRDLAYGKNTFEPVVKLIELVIPDFEREEIVGKFYRVPIELNACTYLEPFYKDFGLAGTILGSLLIGLLCGAAYLHMRNQKNLFSVYFAALLSFCATISIFVNHFTQIATWYFVVTGYVVYRLTLNRGPLPRESFREGIFATSRPAENKDAGKQADDASGLMSL